MNEAPGHVRTGEAGGWAARTIVFLACFLHGWAIWVGMGGFAGIRSPWPLARHDHPLYFHSARVTRAFLHLSGTTAGYDPTFMSGYPKSVIYPASSSLPEVVVFLFGGTNPVLAYKLYVLVTAAAVPWLFLGAAWWARLRSDAIAWGVILLLAYIWTDFPISYATLGMVPYFVAVPLGLVATTAVVSYLERGGFGRWLGTAFLCSLVALAHFTVALVAVPAVLGGYGAVILQGRRRSGGFSAWRHLGFWLIPLVVLVTNAFWWLPGFALASTKGDSSFAFAHPEGMWVRLLKIITTEHPIEAVLWGVGLMGLAALTSKRQPMGTAIAGFAVAGFFWGYGTGAFRSLDFLQPGRHTYALYTALALAGGVSLSTVLGLLRPAVLRRWATVGLLVVGVRIMGPELVSSVVWNLADPLPWLTRKVAPDLEMHLARVRPEPFLSSRPTPRMRWIIDRVSRFVRPGERLLYEEGGKGIPGLADPYEDGRYSGLLPYYVPGIELLGGPYLHAALTTNFTQFGEGKLFERTNWDRDFFVRYARLYRPAAILCWTPWARAFCRDNPDLIAVLDDDGKVLIGRVNGFAGPTIRGRAEVRAEAGLLRVSVPDGELDGPVILRYHFAPCLGSDPPVRLEPVRLENDPVPFIRLRPSTNTTIRLSVASSVRRSPGRPAGP